MENIKQPKRQRNHKDAILVLGMHRSGTSLLGGILDRLGCVGPKSKLAANEQNAKGYFESRPIFLLNDEIFATAGTHWNDWQPLRDNWFESPRFNEFRARAAELVEAEYGDASMIYLKDPRICRLLPFWQDVLEGMGYRLSCIHTHRHPVEVAASMQAREQIAVEPCLGTLSWLRHILEAEANTRSLPRFFTSYSDLIQNWQGFADEAEKALGFSWPAATRSARKKAGQLIDPSLRHHVQDVEAFLRDPLVPAPFREALQVMERWAQVGESDEDRTVLDGLLHDFNQSAALLYAPVDALKTALKKNKTMSRQIGERDEENARLEKEGISNSEELAAQKGTLRDLSQQLAEAGERESELSKEVASWIDRIVERDKEIAELRQGVDLRQSEIGALKAKSDTSSAQLAEVSGREAELLDEVRSWADRVIERDKKASRLQQEMDTLSARLQDMESQHIRAIDDLHNTYKASTSWKVSAPVRFIGRRLLHRQ